IAYRLRENIIEIRVNDTCMMIYVNETSRFIYLSHGHKLHTLNTATMQFLQDLDAEGASVFFEIVGVRNGVITVRGNEKDGDYCYMTAKLPDQYFEIDESYEESENTTRANDDGNDARCSMQPLGLGDCQHNFYSKFIDDFKIKDVLGHGSYGIVFEAVNNYDGWTYAIKRISVKS
ncbi:hypothetical protein PENTCL1PPCAC_3718, partial [Pristionchus entomophagus]